jgi:predicted transcriptional regulator
MRLYDPTDFDILNVMSDGRRYTGSYMGEILNRKGTYMNSRFRTLSGNGLIEKVGNSTMYEITDLGHAALELRDEYAHETSAEWGEQVRGLAADSDD